MELCQTQPTDTTQPPGLSQSLSVSVQHSQREGGDTKTKMMMSHSILSEKSLFGSPPASPGGGSETAEGVVDTSMSSISDEGLFSSQDIEEEQTAGTNCGHVTAEGGTVMLHLNIHSPNTATQNGHSVPTLVYGEEQSSCHDRHEPECDDEQEDRIISGLHVSIRLPIAAHYGQRDKMAPGSLSSDKDRDGENSAQFEPDFELSSRLTSPIPPSPDSKELQRFDFKELDSFNSSGVGRELDNMEISESQLSVPCAQPHHSPSPAMDPQAQADLHKVWNLTPSLAKDSPLKLRPAPATDSQSTVQLEYEMPELSITEFEVSDDPIISALESHTTSPLMKENEDLQTLTSSLPPSQLLRLCSTGSSRRELLRALSNATGDDIDSVGDGRMVEGDGVSVQSEESEQDDGIWMSQEVWDEVEPKSSVSPPHEVTEELVSDKEAKKERHFDLIPQLDGSEDVPSPQGGNKTKMKQKKKTLGVRKQRKSHSLTTVQKTSAVNEPQTTSGEGSESSTPSKEPSGRDSSTKSRRSLSLKKPSKKLHRVKESLKSDEQLESQSQSFMNPNDLEEANTLKEQALNCRFKVHLEKLSSSYFSLRSGISKTPPQVVSKKLPRAVSMRKERYEARVRSKRLKSDSESCPVEKNWKEKLKELSYDQQLKMALEESKKTTSLKKDTPTEQPANSTLVTTTEDKNEDIQMNQTTSIDPALSTSSGTHTDTVKQPTLETSDNQGPISPQLLSPVSTSSSRDLIIRVIDESPLNSDTENEGHEVSMDIQVSQDTVADTNDPKLVTANGKSGCNSVGEVFCQALCQSEHMVNTSSSVVPKQPEPNDDNVHPLDGLLDTTINSICESPPFTSSPIDQERQLDTRKEEILHDSDMKLHLDASFDSEFDVPMETEAATLQTDDSASEAEHEFHLALSSEDDNWNTSTSSVAKENLSAVTTKTTDKVTLSVSVGAPGCSESITGGILALRREPSTIKIVRPLISPPSLQDLMDSSSSYGICSAQHIKPFYSNPTDVQPPM